MCLRSAQAQIQDMIKWHISDLLEHILSKPGTVIVLSDNSFTCALDISTNVFRELLSKAP